MKTVKKCEMDGKVSKSDVGGERQVHYADGTVQTLKLLELSDASNRVTWELHASTPSINVLSVVHTIQLRRITSTKGTFIEFFSDYSADATQDVLQDSKFKKFDFFKALRSAVVKDHSKESKEKPKLERQLSDKSATLKTYFEKLDKNKNGKLEFEEFSVCVNDLLGYNPPELVVRGILEDADQNGDGLIDYNEFVTYLSISGATVPATKAATTTTTSS